MPDSPPTTAAPTAEAIVLDLPPEPVDRIARFGQHATMMLIIIGILGCVVVPCLVFVCNLIGRWLGNNAASDATQIGALIAIVLLAGLALNSIRRRAIARWFQLRSQLPLKRLAEEFNLRRSDPFFNASEPRAFATCVALRHPGRVIRFMPTSDLRPIAPLAVPIEPMLINDRDANFGQLADEPAPPPKPGRLVPHPLPEKKSALTTIFYTPVGSILGIIGALALFNVVTRNVGPAWLQWTILPIASGLFAGLILMARRPQSRGEFWFIVNAAIIVRRRGTLAIFRRSECALIVDYPSASAGRLLVSNGTQTRTYPVTPREATATLRAWLSPLPPPSIDQLSDLQ